MYDLYRIQDGNNSFGEDSWDERKTIYGRLRSLIQDLNNRGGKIAFILPMRDNSLAVIVEAG